VTETKAFKSLLDEGERSDGRASVGGDGGGVVVVGGDGGASTVGGGLGCPEYDLALAKVSNSSLKNLSMSAGSVLGGLGPPELVN
jgi:hypothetical protein